MTSTTSAALQDAAAPAPAAVSPGSAADSTQQTYNTDSATQPKASAPAVVGTGSPIVPDSAMQQKPDSATSSKAVPTLTTLVDIPEQVGSTPTASV
jgi:hypothetical protein